MGKQNKSKGGRTSSRLETMGVTEYLRQGRVVRRPAHSCGRRSNTLGQFVQRQKMRHTIALWGTLKCCDPMFTERRTAFLDFSSLANRLPAVYLPRTGGMNAASLLMPGIPVSDGTLLPVRQRLAEHEGAIVLLTDLTPGTLQEGERLVLFTAVQKTEARIPRVRFAKREVRPEEMAEVEGCLALTGAEFADEAKGWALVRVDRERCSPQGIVTRCTRYLEFTTDEALQEAAKSYGGLT